MICPRSKIVIDLFFQSIILETVAGCKPSHGLRPVLSVLLNQRHIIHCACKNSRIYLGLGSYQLTIKETNGGVGFRGENRVVKESGLCVADTNCKGFSDGKSQLL